MIVQSQYSLTGTKFEQKWNLLKWLEQRLSMQRKKSQEKNRSNWRYFGLKIEILMILGYISPAIYCFSES